MLRLLALTLLIVVPGLNLQAQTQADDCPDTGCCWDKQLNVRKNLREAPKDQPQATSVSVDEIKRYAYPPRWAVGQSRDELKKLGEGRYVSVQAYLVEARWGDLNPANCNRPEPENINVILSLVSKDSLSLDWRRRPLASVTAELTPRVRALHPEWKRNLWKLIRNGRRNQLLVRVKGIMLLDTGRAHSPLNRATDWELHPVLDIEVCARGDCANDVGWKKLEDATITVKSAPGGKQRYKKRRGIQMNRIR